MLINNKAYASQTEGLLDELMDIQNADMIITRGRECEILFMSAAARAHLIEEKLSTSNCRDGYARIFTNMCDNCPNKKDSEYRNLKDPTIYDVTDDKGHITEITGANVTWLDKKSATALFLRDVDDIRKIDNRLYSLAYKDQLTGMPNRQKLLEDCEILPQSKENNICGVLAMIDLDNFKAINDTYGHKTGDIMLKRITEHLSSDDNFKNRLYRLGGDEFVILIIDDAGKFDAEEDIQKYYEKILKRAFFSYTLPNIDLSCTISMGVACFPSNGEKVSELLRKSDIALYKSKHNGRNQMTFFENKFETSKKFKNFYINIKSILTDIGNTYGYELIDTGNENEHGDESMNLNDFDRAIDVLGLEDISNSNRYFIAYSPRIHNAATLRNLPKHKFIIKIHLPQEITNNQYQSYKLLRSKGFLLMVSNLTEKTATPRLMELADFFRFASGQASLRFQKNLIASYPNRKFIATGIDTQEAYENAKDLGYRFFQGTFFKYPQPVVRKEKGLEPLKLNYLRLLHLTGTNDYVDFHQISDVIQSDIALSYKLLQLLNGPAIGIRNRISSISMAVSYLGEDSLKKWIALLSVRGVAQDKPLELIRVSLIRAQFGELLAANMKPARDKKFAFMAGMFSLLHIAMDKTKEEVMKEIPVADAITDSILTHDGPYSDLLKFFDDYDNSNWDEVTKFADKNGLKNHVIYDSYVAAVKWYNGIAEDEE